MIFVINIRVYAFCPQIKRLSAIVRTVFGAKSLILCARGGDSNPPHLSAPDPKSCVIKSLDTQIA